MTDAPHTTVTYLTIDSKERETRQLTQAPDPVQQAKDAPEAAYGFYYGEPCNVYYIDGTAYSKSNFDVFPIELDPQGFLRADIVTMNGTYVRLRNSDRMAWITKGDEVVSTA